MSEREQLRGFVGHVAEFMDDLFAGPNKGVGADLRQAVRNAQRLAGLRQAASDMVEWTTDLSPEQVKQLDSRLERAGLPTLSQMRDSRYRQLRSILSKRTINREGDYRLLEQVLSDTASSALSEAELHRAKELLANFSKGNASA